jgi:hypothetical protein
MSDDERIRKIFREELAAFFAGQRPEDIQADADHMARLIREGRSGEVKAIQRQRMRRAA